MLRNKEISKKILLAQPVGISKRGRTKLRWRDEVDEDAKKVRNKELGNLLMKG